jgi:hypothetical protein
MLKQIYFLHSCKLSKLLTIVCFRLKFANCFIDSVAVCLKVLFYGRLRRPPQQQRPVSNLLPLSPRAYSWGAGQYPGQLPGEAEICLCQGAEHRAATIRAHRWSR